MRRPLLALSPVASIASLAVILAAAATCRADAPLFQQLRADHPVIDAALAHMPNGSRRGSFNRISALLAQPKVRELAPGSSALVPPVSAQQMTMEINSLESELQAGLPALGLRDRLILAQVLDVVAVRRNVELWSDAPSVDCTALAADETCPNPAVIQALDRLVGTVQQSINVAAVASGATGYDASAGPATAQDFEAWLHAAIDALSAVAGVESIDQ